MEVKRGRFILVLSLKRWNSDFYTSGSGGLCRYFMVIRGGASGRSGEALQVHPRYVQNGFSFSVTRHIFHTRKNV
jgi:hypothetical protein